MVVSIEKPCRQDSRAPLLIQARGISHAFSGGHVLNGIDCDVATGETVAIVGRSGVGKSTLLKVLARLIPPRAGHIDYALSAGQPMRIGFVFQDHELFPWLTVRQNIAMAAAHGVQPDHAGDKIDRIAAQLSLSDALHLYPGQLSGGMRQRAAIARALVNDPHLLCMDEPFSALDPILRREARAAVGEAIRLSGAATLMVTHDIADALLFADRLWVLRRSDKGASLRIFDRATVPGDPDALCDLF